MKLCRFPLVACLLSILGMLAVEGHEPASDNIAPTTGNDVDLDFDKRTVSPHVPPLHDYARTDASPSGTTVSDQVQQIDDIALERRVPVLTDCTVQKALAHGCLILYDLIGSGLGGCSLESVLRDLFHDGAVAQRLQKHSRGILQPAIFQCDQVLFDKCLDRQEMEFSCRSISDQSVEANRFLVFESVTLRKVNFNYKDFAHGVGNKWMRLDLKGDAILKVGDKTIGFDIDKKFERPATGGGEQTVADFDTDVSLDILPSQYVQLGVSDVLSMFQMTVEELYPQELYMDRAVINFEGLTFNSDEKSIHVDVGEGGIFSFNVFGNRSHVFGSPLLNDAEQTILVCQSGEDLLHPREVSCGIAAKIERELFRYVSILGITEDDIRKLQAFEGLNQVVNLLILSSKRGISYSGWKKVNELGTIFNLSNRGGEMLVPPGLSVKFRMKPSANLRSKMPGVKVKFAFAWREANGVKIQIPTLGKLQNEALQGFMPIPDNFSIGDAKLATGIRQTASVVEIRIKTSQNIAAEYCLTIKPGSNLTVIPACREPQECVLNLRNTTITKCYNNISKQWDLSGSGLETNVVGSVSNTTVTFEEHQPVVIGNLLTSNMAELNSEFAKYGGYTVPDEKQVPHAIANFTIMDLQYEAEISGKQRMKLWGNAKVCANTAARIEAIFYKKVAQTWNLGTCITFAKVDLASIVNLIFDKIFLSQGWLHFEHLTFVIGSTGSPAGNVVSFASPTCRHAEHSTTAQDTLVRVAASELDLTPCHGVHGSTPAVENKTLTKPCLFLKRIMGDNPPAITYHGHLTNSTFYAKATIGSIFNLGGSNNITFEGVSGVGAEHESERSNIIGYLSADTESDNGGDSSFRGTLVLGNTASRVHAEILFHGDAVLIHAPPSNGPVSRMRQNYNPNLLMIPNVQMRNNRIRRYEIPHNEPLEYIIFAAGMDIGSSATRKITITGTHQTKQYVYGVNGENRNKFIACALEERHFTLADILAAFDVNDLQYEPLRRLEIIDVCFAYQNSEDVWNISSKGILAPKGLHLFGMLDTHDEHKRPVTIELKGSGEVVVKLEVPPLQWATSKARQCPTEKQIDSLRPCPFANSKPVDYPDACLKAGCCWNDEIAKRNGLACHDFSDTLLNVTRLEMVASSDTPSVGPLLTVVYSGGSFSSARIDGFTSGIGFREQKTLSISRVAAGVCRYEMEHVGLVYEQLQGKVKFTATHCGENITNARFQLTVDVQDDLRRKIRASSAATFAIVANETQYRFEGQVLNASRDIESWKDRIFAELREGDEAISAMEREMREHNQRLQSSTNSMRRSCVNHCRPVHMPNWKWNDACVRSSDGRTAGCMKYDKHANIVSNVGCLAICEAGRVRSLEHVEDNIAETQRRLPELLAKLECRQIGQHLRGLVLGVSSEAGQMLNDTQRKMRFLSDLQAIARRNNDGLVALGLFTLSCDLADVVELKCFNFTIEVSAANAQGGFVAWPRTVGGFCFNGELAETITKFAFKNLYPEFEDLQKSVDLAEKSIAILTHKRNNEILDLHTAYTNCIRDKRALKANADRERAAAESAESAPSVRTLKQAAIDAAKFTTANDRTILSFKYYSPWATLDRAEDPFLQAEKQINLRHNISPVRRITRHGDHPCNVTRRSLVELRDVAEFMESWSKAHENGRKSLEEVKRNIKSGLHAARNTIDGYARECRKDHLAEDQISYWMNETDRGMAKWLEESAHRLSEHDLKGMSLMKRNLESFFAGHDHDNFESFLHFVEKEATKAYKRSFESSSTHDHGSFHAIVHNIRSVLALGRLSEASGFIKSLSDLVTQVDKRTLSCLM